MGEAVITSVDVYSFEYRCPRGKVSCGADTEENVCVEKNEIWIIKCEHCGEPHKVGNLADPGAARDFLK